jgi:hypothetical protein
LKDYVVHGVVTNIDLLQDILAHPDFQNGRVSTVWVEEAFHWQPPAPSVDALLAAAAADISAPGTGALPSGPVGSDPFSPWRSMEGFRN